MENEARASEIGMYVDTSGVKYTNPIQGLHHLTGLKKINLILALKQQNTQVKKT